LTEVISRQFYVDVPTRCMVELVGVSVAAYAWQVKVLDHLSLFSKLAPLLESRLEGSGYGGLCETLNLNFRKFNIKMTVKNGKIVGTKRGVDCRDRTIGLNPYVFPQLLLGHRGVTELEAAYPDVRITDTHRPILEAMFPRRPGYIFHVY